MQGEIIKWKGGEIICEGSSCVVYKAFNLEDGSIFVVKRFISINDTKSKEMYQVNFFIKFLI